jgi:hypothetical protein
MVASFGIILPVYEFLVSLKTCHVTDPSFSLSSQAFEDNVLMIFQGNCEYIRSISNVL